MSALRARTSFHNMRSVLVPNLHLALSLANPHGPTVEWTAPPECPSASEIRAQIEASLSGAPRRPAKVIKAIVYRPNEQIYRLSVGVVDPIFGIDLRNPVDADNCTDLAANFVHFAAASWADEAVPAKPARRQVQGRVRLGGYGGYGLLPRNGFGGGQLVFGLAWKYVRIEVGASADGVTNIELQANQPGFHSNWVRATLLLRGCGVVPAGSLELHFCAGVEGGFVAGRSTYWNPLARTFDAHLAPAVLWWFHQHVGLWTGVSGGPFLGPMQPVRNGEILGTTWFFVTGGAGLEFRWDR